VGDVGVKEGIAREAAEAEKSKCAENMFAAVDARVDAKADRWPFTRFDR
jgi:hypothetical protein